MPRFWRFKFSNFWELCRRKIRALFSWRQSYIKFQCVFTLKNEYIKHMQRSTWKILVAFSIIKYPKDEKGFKSNNDILNHKMLLSKIFSECTINFEQWRFSSVLPTVTGGNHLNSYLRELDTVLTSAAERLHGSRSGVVSISFKNLDPSRPGFKHATFACEANALSDCSCVEKLEYGNK